MDWELYFENNLFTSDAQNLLNAYNTYYTVMGYVSEEKSKLLKIENFLINKPKQQEKQQTSDEQFEMINNIISKLNNKERKE